MYFIVYLWYQAELVLFGLCRFLLQMLNAITKDRQSHTQWDMIIRFCQDISKTISDDDNIRIWFISCNLNKLTFHLNIKHTYSFQCDFRSQVRKKERENEKCQWNIIHTIDFYLVWSLRTCNKHAHIAKWIPMVKGTIRLR